MSILDIGSTNFDNGMTNNPQDHIFGSMGMPDPTKFITHWDDFNTFPTFVDGTGNYTAPQTGSIQDEAIVGGVITLISGPTSGDEVIIRTQNPAFSLNSSNKTYFRIKQSIGAVLNRTFIGGLIDTVDQGLFPNQGIFFQMLSGTNVLDLVVRIGSSQVLIASNIATIPENMYFTLEFYWDGISKIYYGMGNSPLGSLDVAGLVFEDDITAPAIGIVAGDNGVGFLATDYIFANQERN